MNKNDKDEIDVMLHSIHEMYHLYFTQYVFDAKVLSEYLDYFHKSNVS